MPERSPGLAVVTVNSLTENSRGVIIGELTGENANLDLRLPLECVAATLGDAQNALGTVNLRSTWTVTGSTTLDDEFIVGLKDLKLC